MTMNHLLTFIDSMLIAAFATLLYLDVKTRQWARDAKPELHLISTKGHRERPNLYKNKMEEWDVRKEKEYLILHFDGAMNIWFSVEPKLQKIRPVFLRTKVVKLIMKHHLDPDIGLDKFQRYSFQTALNNLKSISISFAKGVQISHVSCYQDLTMANDVERFNHFCQEGDILLRATLKKPLRIELDTGVITGPYVSGAIMAKVIFFSLSSRDINVVPKETINDFVVALIERYVETDKTTVKNIQEVKAFNLERMGDCDGYSIPEAG